MWSRQESNLDLKFRKLLFYPLNYGTINIFISKNLHLKLVPKAFGIFYPRLNGVHPGKPFRTMAGQALNYGTININQLGNSVTFYCPKPLLFLTKCKANTFYKNLKSKCKLVHVWWVVGVSHA